MGIFNDNIEKAETFITFFSLQAKFWNGGNFAVLTEKGNLEVLISSNKSHFHLACLITAL